MYKGGGEKGLCNFVLSQAQRRRLAGQGPGSAIDLTHNGSNASTLLAAELAKLSPAANVLL